MNTLELFRGQLDAWGVDLPTGAEDLLQDYARLLTTYDKANVIGTRDFDRVMLDHILDSLGCLLFSPAARALKFVDVGSGGGLPGIPLAIAFPDASFTLLEVTGKKAAFLRYAVESLNLTGVEIVNARVEQAAHDPGLRASHGICTVRAVAKLSVLAEYCLPLLGVGGWLVAMKGGVTEEEHRGGERAAALLGGGILQTVEVPLLPEMEQKTRRLVVLEKVAETPEIYPRRVGLPAKSPLGQA